MTRRDIIIIAVLINAGLLAVLFMMAINTDEEKAAEPIEITQVMTEIKPAEPSLENSSDNITIISTTADEGDNALQAFESTGPQVTEFTKPSQPSEEDLVQDLDQDDDLPPKVEQPKEEVPSTPAPSKAAEEPAKPAPKTVEVTVKRGDSLDKIARANGTTIKAIKEANNLKSDRLDIGQVLKVPTSTKKSTTSTTQKSAKSSTSQLVLNDPQYYTVKSGDNPWKIAKQFNLKVDDLLKLNNLNEEKARNLKVGDKIRIR